MSRQIIDSDGNKKFDARVHIRDPKNGRIEKVRAYTLKCVGDTQIYIDKTTGKKYSPDGEEIVEPSLADAVSKPAPAPQKPAPASNKNAPKSSPAPAKHKVTAAPVDLNLPPVADPENPEPALEDPNHPSAQSL